ncbi:MAG: hypothetical protein KA758_01435 [Acidimicrobiales bacterium]|jgi:hypothetical protein|nr:hypothetical protein [Acidimicrobiales bacterium]
MPVTNKVSARVQFLYGDGSVEVIKVPADLIERDLAYRGTRLYGGITTDAPIWDLSGGRVDGPYRTARAAGYNAFVILGVEP